MVTGDEYWLYRWIDDHNVRSAGDAENLLNDRVGVADLRAKACDYPSSRKGRADQRLTIAAGAAIDFSGRLNCPAAACRKQQVDQLLRKVWHYFDCVIVADSIGHAVACHWNEHPKRYREEVAQTVGVLLYLREIGADSLLGFVEKDRHDCELHWRRHAKEAGLQRILAAADAMVPQLAREGKFTFRNRKSGLGFRFEHPQLEHTIWGDLTSRELRRDRKIAAAQAVVRRYVAYLTTDVVTAADCESPLGTAVDVHEQLLTEGGGNIVGSAPFGLILPVLEHVPVRYLLKLRADEGDAFIRFQQSLRKAMVDRNHHATGRNGVKLADEIRNDVIAPELDRIRARLHAAEKTLKRKASVGVFLGGFATTCGLIAGAPLPAAVAAGVAAISGVAGTAASKYLDERNEVSLSDMYFLWKAIEHVH
jgi:hypothetical protein